MKNYHKYLLKTVLAVLLPLALVSCGKGEDVIDAATTDNALLAYVPADTPYLAGNLEPVPNEVIEANFRRAQPALDAVQAALADTRLSLSGSAARENPEIAIFGALLEELDGKLNREGLESLGISMDAYQVVYGMGVFPVVRISLKDAQALREAIGRIEANSGLEFAELTLQGQPYWNLTANAAETGHDIAAGIYMAIIEEQGGAHLAVGVLPSAAEAQLLPAFLGREKPPESTAALRLAEITNDYGYQGYGTAVLDFDRLFDQFADPTSLARQLLVDNGVDLDKHLDTTCRNEIRGLIARAPRIVAGVTELTPATMGIQYRLELADDLASEMAELVSNVPAAPAQSDRLLEFAFGIRVGAARDFLIRKATALSQESFQCEALQGINRQASQALTKLNYPMPPLVNNFLGLRASLDGVPEDETDLAALLGTVALHVDKPEMFVGMAQMMLPQMEQVQLAKGEPPVRLPESLIPMPGIVAHAAMSDTAIGIALGQGEQARLLDYLEAESDGDGSFVSANYDMAAYMDKMDELTGQLESAGLSDDSIADGEFEGEGLGAANTEMKEIAEAIRETMRNMAGRSYFSMRFDDSGFAVDSKIEFKE